MSEGRALVKSGGGAGFVMRVGALRNSTAEAQRREVPRLREALRRAQRKRIFCALAAQRGSFASHWSDVVGSCF